MAEKLWRVKIWLVYKNDMDVGQGLRDLFRGDEERLHRILQAPQDKMDIQALGDFEGRGAVWMKGAAWFLLSIAIIMALLFTFVIAPILFRPSTSKEPTLSDFCAPYGMEARQKFFAGITQCYKATVIGQTTTEIACDVVNKNGVYQWKTSCSVEVPKPEFRIKEEVRLP